MRSRFILAVLASALLLGASARAKAAEPKFKTAETKHFGRAEGVELTPDFNDYLYAELRTQLQKTNLFGQVIGEGEVVEAADAPASVVVSGTLTEYKKGSVAKAAIIGFTAGWRSLKMQVDLTRRSDQKSLATIEVHVRASPRWNEKVLAQEAARELAKQIKNSLQHESAS
jgi:Domain of unknown function (DUF4410)